MVPETGIRPRTPKCATDSGTLRKHHAPTPGMARYVFSFPLKATFFLEAVAPFIARSLPDFLRVPSCPSWLRLILANDPVERFFHRREGAVGVVREGLD